MDEKSIRNIISALFLNANPLFGHFLAKKVAKKKHQSKISGKWLKNARYEYPITILDEKSIRNILSAFFPCFDPFFGHFLDKKVAKNNQQSKIIKKWLKNAKYEYPITFLGKKSIKTSFSHYFRVLTHFWPLFGHKKSKMVKN